MWSCELPEEGGDAVEFKLLRNFDFAANSANTAEHTGFEDGMTIFNLHQEAQEIESSEEAAFREGMQRMHQIGLEILLNLEPNSEVAMWINEAQIQVCLEDAAGVRSC